METNTCNLGHHPDTDALLPPRKRLLAGFKRQNSDISSPSPSKNDIPLKARFMAHINDSNLSIEEIVKVSGIGAIEAAKVAEAAKAKAEEKAAKAAKAIAAAKSALDLVATLTDEAAKKEKCLRRNKMKKHISVEELYSNKNKGNSSCGTDEELARDLHRSISNNNSPRILTTSDVKIHKHKKLNGAVGNLDTEGPVKEIGNVMIDLSASSKSDQSYQLKASSLEVSDGFGKTRRKIKQKKLPLSICSFRDRNAVEGEYKCRGNPLGDNSVATDGALFSSATNLTTVENASMWKCQSMKAPACLKQNKVMRS